MKKNGLLSLIFILILALALILTGCAPAGNAAGTDPQNQTAGQTSQTGNPTTITAEEAQNIALEHAGFTVDQVTGLRAEYDLDDGVPEYEVEFRQDRWEYEYEIHAETGEIRTYDRDD